MASADRKKELKLIMSAKNKRELKHNLMSKQSIGSAKSQFTGRSGAGSWPADACTSFISRGSGTFSSRNVLSWASSNSTLLSYLYDTASTNDDVQTSWHALTPGCRIMPLGCWCFHVAGSMVKADNPNGHRRCVPKDRLMDCSSPAAGPFYVKAKRNCSCFAQAPAPAPPCLFGDMRPAKLLAIIAACRALGVTHIIEQGRYGGCVLHRRTARERAGTLSLLRLLWLLLLRRPVGAPFRRSHASLRATVPHRYLCSGCLRGFTRSTASR